MSDEAPDLNRVLEHYECRVKDRTQYMTSCPFHEDRTPSLSVHTGKGVWRCQSCGRKGNTIGLIMQKEECDYRRATELGATLGIATGSARGSGGQLRKQRDGFRGTSSDRSRYRPRYRG